MCRSVSFAAHAQFFLAISGARQWLQGRSAQVPHSSPATHEQLANGLSNTDPRGHAIVSGLSCASGRLINNITALLTHQRHNVFFNTCRVLLNWGLRYKSLGSRAALLKWTVSAVLLVQVFEGGAGACRCRLAGSGYRHLCFRYEAMNRTCICGMAK